VCAYVVCMCVYICGVYVCVYVCGVGQKNQNIKQEQHCNKFYKDFKNESHKKIFKNKTILKESMCRTEMFMIY